MYVFLRDSQRRQSEKNRGRDRQASNCGFHAAIVRSESPDGKCRKQPSSLPKSPLTRRFPATLAEAPDRRFPDELGSSDLQR
jgi:hypothetical protein